MKKLVARLENQTQLLFLDMSTKSVDIRCREAAASRGHFERLLTAACERLKRQADDEKAKLMAINAKFDSEVLKGEFGWMRDGGFRGSVRMTGFSSTFITVCRIIIR